MSTDPLFIRFFRAARLALPAAVTALAIAATSTTAQQAAPTQAQVTFTKEVAPILYRSCVRCHRPDEIATIVKWVDGGALQGNPADMPPMPALEDLSTWRIGKPDLVIKYPTFRMPAHGPDLYATQDAPFGTTEDRYIKAIQSRVVDSTSRKIVHHALSYAVEPGDNSEGGDDSGGGSGLFLVEYASGKNATFYAEDAGLLLP